MWAGALGQVWTGPSEGVLPFSRCVLGIILSAKTREYLGEGKSLIQVVGRILCGVGEVMGTFSGCQWPACQKSGAYSG